MIQRKRNTKAKALVFSVLSDSASALGNDDIVSRLSGRLGRVTVYRILQGFCEEGKVHRITGDNGKTYYTLCQGCTEGFHDDNHIHFRCIGCDTVSCLGDEVSFPELPAGYRVLGASFVLSGYCPGCLST
ncbi:MAG: transcriptional repressor [Dysgonamonadaceae bacterium]|nr:transcriptional repressor [Dysgonamonadaceae bacterium]